MHTSVCVHHTAPYQDSQHSLQGDEGESFRGKLSTPHGRSHATIRCAFANALRICPLHSCDVRRLLCLHVLEMRLRARTLRPCTIVCQFQTALSQTTWPQAVLEDTESYKSILSHLLNLLPKQPAQVVSMQSAKGVMSTWDEVRSGHASSLCAACELARCNTPGCALPLWLPSSLDDIKRKLHRRRWPKKCEC